MLSLNDIHFAYGAKKVLQGLSFAVQKGEIVSLIGMSGSGKTTLFRLITGLLNPDRGEITCPREALTYMRQEDLLLPWRTVLGNLSLLQELGTQAADPTFDEKARALLAKLGLAGTEETYPRTLSGGMRQRVSLARALLQNRPLLLLDEPFGSLDVVIREQLYTLLRHIRSEMGKTILLVTHDFRDALALSDQILVLDSGGIGAEFHLDDTTRKDPTTCQAISDSIRRRLTEGKNHRDHREHGEGNTETARPRSQSERTPV